MKRDRLYLASQSFSRRQLLDYSGIDYQTIEHTSDECVVPREHDFHGYVMSIAQHKMDAIVLPSIEQDDNVCFVLTADSLVFTPQSRHILGKPEDLADAKRMLALMREEPVEVVTACCLHKKVVRAGRWEIDQEISWTTSAVIEFYVDQDLEDWYFEKMPRALQACGAGIIEGFGDNFLKSVNGSYSAVKGLPLFELRQALKKIGFRF
ncbi:Maf family protein [Candidatus Babeliales bacterium]|nr:Maf family protein [Candidatus Babeliales bacterium]